MGDNEILKHLHESAKEDLMFYSNAGKEGRERWVVSEFLKIIGLPFEEIEVISMEQSSKTDVSFRDASFQVKEIPNPGTLIGKRVKDTYNSIKSAKMLEDIVLSSTAEDIPQVTKMYGLVMAKSKELAESKTYNTSMNNLDLIFYITRTRASLILNKEIKTSDFSSMGWRSVSCINSKQAVVVYAASDAPKFLRKQVGKIIEHFG